MMQKDAPEETTANRARRLAANLTERIANTLIRPPEGPLEGCTLVITTMWRTDDPEVVSGAVHRGRERAEKGSSGTLSKAFFGMLRFLGMGYVEPTGEGGVEVVQQDGTDDIYVVTTKIGVRVEDMPAMAAGLVAFAEKAKKLPSGILCALTGVKPGKAALVGLEADIA